MINEELERVFSYHKWRQNIPIKDGIFTPGHIYNNIWSDLHLPEKVDDLIVLDIGSNDGQIAFEAERRGAKKVYASDLYINKLETMANGWPVEGISILKDVMNSNIIIHKEGIFGLENIKEHFDIVILNNVLNWIGDIDLVISTLAKLNFNKLYIADQFLAKKNINLKKPPQTPELKMFKELCNKNYLISKFDSFGILLEKTTSFSTHERHIRKYIEQNKIASIEEINIYNLPNVKSTIKSKSKINGISYYLFNDFFFLRNVGWVKKEDVSVRKNKFSVWFNLFRKLELLNIYIFMKGWFKKNETENHLIIFRKSSSHFHN